MLIKLYFTCLYLRGNERVLRVAAIKFTQGIRLFEENVKNMPPGYKHLAWRQLECIDGKGVSLMLGYLKLIGKIDHCKFNAVKKHNFIFSAKFADYLMRLEQLRIRMTGNINMLKKAKQEFSCCTSVLELEASSRSFERLNPGHVLPRTNRIVDFGSIHTPAPAKIAEIESAVNKVIPWPSHQ